MNLLCLFQHPRLGLLVLLAAVGGLFAPLHAQTPPALDRVEYFFDTDPGPGQGTALTLPATPGTSLSNLAFSVSLAPLAPGFHSLFVRSRAGTSRWSQTYRQILYKEPATALGAAPNLTGAEYFVDADPGYGQGTAIAITGGSPNAAGVAFTVGLGSVPAGFHSLSVRSRDAAGQWSQTYRQIFYVEPPATTAPPAALAAVEYFVDADPGYGQGSSAAITGGGTNATGVSFTVGLGSLAAGFHTLYYRVRDAAGKWSQTQSRLFYVDDAALAARPVLNKAEYYFDTDPGYNLGTDVPISTPATSLPALSLLADASALADGPHRLFVRVRDAAGKWSQVLGRSFAKNGCASSLNLAAGLPATSYTAGGSVGGTPALAFSEPAPVAPTTSTAPYVYNGGYLQVDLGTPQTVGSLGLTLTPSANASYTLLLQTASAPAGPYTTVDTYTANLTAGTSYPVTRTLATPAAGVRAVRLLLQNSAGAYALVSGAGLYYFNCVAPSLASVTPASGPVGTTIALGGANLAGTSVVTFSGSSGNTVSSGYTVNAAGTAITGLVVPAGAQTGSITVTSPSGTSNSVAFTVTVPPALSSLAPNSGPLGSTLTLNGTNLTGTTAITFAGSSNNVVTTGYSVNATGTAITGVVVPAGATTGSVTVTTPGGTSNGLAFTVTTTQLAVSQGGTSYPSGGAAYGFGSQAVGTSSAPVAFTLSNAGTGALALSSVSTTGNYALSGSVPASVPAGGSATVQVVFTPTAIGTRPGTLVIVSALGTYTVNLTGTGSLAAPVISSFTPASGPVGTSVAVSGQNLTGATAVTFNGTAASSYTVNAAGTQLTVAVPTGASTGLIAITTPGGTATSASSFTVTASAPTLTSLTPTSGPVGTTIALNGTNLTGTTAITFAGTSSNVVATGFAVNAAGTAITGVVVPAGAQTGSVTVTTPSGTSNGLVFTVTVPAAAQLAVSQGGTAYPSSGAAYDFGSQVVGAGSPVVGFTLSNAGGSALTISSMATTGDYATSGTLPTGIAAGGTVLLNVAFTPTAAGPRPGTLVITSALGTYTVNLTGTGTPAIPTAPALTGLTPNNGVVGSTITINGTNLTGATAITFAGSSGNVVTTGYSVNAAGTAITGVVVPAGAQTGSVAVTTPGGTSNNLAFTVTVPAAAQLAVSQNSTSYPSGGAAYSFGSQLVGTSSAAVAFTLSNAGGVPLAINGVATTGDYAISGPVPTSLAAGGSATVQVVFTPTTTGTRPGTLVTTSALGTYTVNLTGVGSLAAPTLTSLTPSSGLVGSAITINGANLTGATAITFAGSSNNVVTTGYTVNAAGTAITGVVVPTGAVTGSLTVTTPGGTSNDLAFTVTVAALPDLVISTGSAASPVSVAAGAYNSLTITAGGVGVLLGATSVAGSVSVSGTLLTACQPLTGPASFTLAAGATLGICNPLGLSTAAGQGAVQTTGARSFSPDATYLYNGPAAQTTGDALPAQVRSLTVANPQPVTLTQAVRVTRVLTLSSTGDLLLNGQSLTLLSSVAGTALVVNSGAGVVQGATGIMQRYLDASGNLGSSGYRHFSAPVSGSTVADLATTATGGSFAPVLNPAYNTSAQPAAVSPFPTVFGYDQSRLATATSNLSNFDKGWFSPAALTDALGVGRGYTVQLGNSELVDFTGTFTTGPVQLGSLTRGAGTDAGWQLLGNPYPAPLDWGTVGAAGNGSGRAGLDAAAYVYQSTGPYVGRYSAFVNGVGAGTGVLAAGQGFFVRTSAPGAPGTLTLTNANRLTTYGSQPAVQRPNDLRPLLRLSLALGSAPATPATAQDEAFVYFEAGATAGFDGGFDAQKLPNSSGYYLATATPGSPAAGLSVSGRAPLTTGQPEEVVPVWLSAPAGRYALTATELANFASMAGGTTVYLRDALTGTLTDLSQQPSYAFSVAAGAAGSGRFSLVFHPAAALGTAAGPGAASVVASLYPNPAAAATAVTLTVTGLPAALLTLTATLLDAVGRPVGSYPLRPARGSAQLVLPTANLPSGVYLLRLAAPDAPGQPGGGWPTLRLSLQ